MVGDQAWAGEVRHLDTFANEAGRNAHLGGEIAKALGARSNELLVERPQILQGRVAMVKDFGPEAQQAVTATTQAAFSNYRVRFINPDVAVADALLTVHNVNGPNGTIIPVIPIKFFYVAARHGDQWLIEDGRAHFAPAPANSMTDHAMAAHN